MSSPKPGPSRRFRRRRYHSGSSDSSSHWHRQSPHSWERSSFRSRSGSPASDRSHHSPPPQSPVGSVRSARSRSGSPRSRSGSPRSRPGSVRSGSARTGSARSRSASLGSILGSVRSRSGSPRSRLGSLRSRSGSPRSRSGSPRSRSGSPRSRSGSPRSRSGSPRSGSGSARTGSARARSLSPLGSMRSRSRSGSVRSGSAVSDSSSRRRRKRRRQSNGSLAHLQETSATKKVLKWVHHGDENNPSKEGLAQRFRFSMMRESETLTDMTLICDGKKFPCHKLILASSSQYFDRMFQSEMQEMRKNEVTLSVISADIMSMILDYMYSADIRFTWQTISDLLRAADYLQMDTLKDMGSRYLMDKLRPSSAMLIHRMARSCNLQRAEKKAWSTITNHFREVSCSRHFLRLPVEDLKLIIASSALYVANEDPVVHAVLSWTHHNLSRREKDFHTQLRPLLRLSYCTKYMLSHLISSEPLLEGHRGELAVALAQAVSPPCHVPRLDSPGPRDAFLQHRHCLVLYGSVVKQPGDRHYSEYCDMYFLDQNPYWQQPRDQELEWKLIDDLDAKNNSEKPFHRDRHLERQVEYSVCALPRGFFVTGGREMYEDVQYDTYLSARAAMFNFETLAWHDVEDMQDGRYKHASIYLNEEVFVLGGANSSRLLPTMNVFDLVCGQWQVTSTRIPHRVAYPAVATLGLNIYVFGGQDSSERFSSHTQVFNTCLNKWSSGARMPATPQYAGAVAVAGGGGGGVSGGAVYVVGGLQPPVCLRYSPREDTWVTLRPPTFHHAHAALTTWRGRVVVGGGLYQAENSTAPHSQIEMYDADTDTWEKAPSPPLTSQLPAAMSHVCFAFAVYNDVKAAEAGYEHARHDTDSDSYSHYSLPYMH